MDPLAQIGMNEEIMTVETSKCSQEADGPTRESRCALM